MQTHTHTQETRAMNRKQSHEHTCKNLQQNISKFNSTMYKKGYIPKQVVFIPSMQV